MEPLVRFTQWLGRCLCHSESDAGAAACPWKGCVGPQLATLVQKTVAELSDLRQARMASAASAGASDSSCSSDIAASAELAMADLLTKFHWVQEPPYLVWQASLAPRLRARCVVTVPADRGLFGEGGCRGVGVLKMLCLFGRYCLVWQFA